MLRAISFCAIGLLGVSIAMAQPKSSPKPFDAAARTAKIEAALASEASIQYENTPLSIAIEHLSDEHGLPIHVDQGALDLLGISGDTKITVKIEKVRLSDGLTLMLRDLDLHWTVHRGVVEITSPEEVYASLTTVVYDASELYRQYPFTPGVIYSSAANLELQTVDATSLIYLIARTVEPESWEELGGPATIEAWNNGEKDLIIIRQDYHTHKKIAAFLQELRKYRVAQEKKVSVDDKITRLYRLSEKAKATPDELLKLVKVTFADIEWNDDSIHAIAGVLVVKHSLATQQKVASLLLSLGAVEPQNQGFESSVICGINGTSGKEFKAMLKAHQ